MLSLDHPDKFVNRHIGPSESEIKEMANFCGVETVEELIDQTIPGKIRLRKDIELEPALSEVEFINLMNKIAKKNKVYKSYIGMGYYPTVLPQVIQRNVLENPGWYTQYTPYQAEIAQGRLEALLNFQTMVLDLTGMAIANSSLLDEATAAAEAMVMFFNLRKRDKQQSKKFFVSE
ncbi:MAG: glycine dehydrogenase (aminomethyl-transferring), partial [Ignavibacteriaceae bacterium]